jgi:ABC-type enterobactin transport system permease subunit
MPDAQSLNAVLNAYGISNLLGSGGDFNWWNIIGGIIFSIIGWYAFWHGKKEKNWRAVVIGIALMVYPYFVSNAFLAFAIGIAMTAALYFWRE